MSTVRRSMSIIEKDDRFLFNGLRGELGHRSTGIITEEQMTEDQYDNDSLIIVDSISVDGLVWITVEMPNSGTLIRSKHLSLPYDLALKLIDERIWQNVEELND